MTPTNATTKAIIDYLNLRNHVAWRNNTVGVYDPVGKRFRSGPVSSRGVGDVLCCLKGGRLLEVEVKTGKDKLNPFQVVHRDKIVAANGLYVMVHTFDEFKRWYSQVVESFWTAS